MSDKVITFGEKERVLVAGRLGTVICSPCVDEYGIDFDDGQSYYVKADTIKSISRAVFVDDLFMFVSNQPQARRVGERHGHRWCHLFCEPGNEFQLHFIAYAVGMRPQWFQDKQGFPHYDLVPPRRIAAVKLGVTEVTLLEYLRANKRARSLHLQ